MNNLRQFDVIIIGGGMVGLTAACAIADADVSVCVVDNASPCVTNLSSDYDFRVSALTVASQQLLKNIDAWNDIVERRTHPFRDMHVWDGAGAGHIHFTCTDVGEPALGHIVENSVIVAALTQAAARRPNITHLCQRQPKRWLQGQDRVGVELNFGEHLQAKLIIGADGAQSWVRAQMGVRMNGWSYKQHGVVCTVRSENSHRDTAWQKFLPAGPLALLPLGDGRCSIVWSTSSAQAQQLLALTDDAFLAEMNRALGTSELGAIVQASPRAAFPLHLQHTLNYVAPRVALIGDAAHTVHPLAGQGVNLGLLDAAALAEEITKAIHARRDIGDFSTLRRYERRRKGHNLMVMGVMDGFKRGFGSQFLPVVGVRNLGLTLTNHFSALKREIIRHAMGLTGDLPELVKKRV